LAPNCFDREFNGGRKITGSIVETPAINAPSCREQNIFPLVINVLPSNRHGPWQRRQAVQQGHRPVAAPVRRRWLQGDSAGDRGGTFIRRVFVVTEGFLAVTDPFRHFAWSEELPGCFVTSFIVVK
jgi:hypothetical protein